MACVSLKYYFQWLVYSFPSEVKQSIGSLGAGVFKYVSILETKITEKEKEIENHKLQYCSVEASWFITQIRLLYDAKHITKK